MNMLPFSEADTKSRVQLQHKVIMDYSYCLDAKRRCPRETGAKEG